MWEAEFNYTCPTCGRHFESHKGERFTSFSDRIYDLDVSDHIANGSLQRSVGFAKTSIDLGIHAKRSNDG